MKSLLIFAVFLSCSTLTTQAQPLKDSLYKLYKAKQYPALKKANSNESHPLYHFYKAVYANACNRPEESNQFLQLYLGKKKKPEAAIAFEYYQLEHDNQVRSFEYKKAAASGAFLLKKFKKQFKPDEIKGNENAKLIWEALQNEPKQYLQQALADSIPFIRDMAGLINIKVHAGNTSSNFIFDTGAGLSCITETYAAKMGFRILPDSGILVAGFNNIYNPVKIAVADTLRFGQLTVFNEPFLVFKDEAFIFANGAYRINGIIGFPIAKGLGRISITAKHLIVEKHQRDNPLLEPNFFVETLRPILILQYKGKSMPFNFDTGANSSDFFKPFFEADSTTLLQAGSYVEKQAASAGGSSKHRVLEVPSLEFLLNGETISIPKPGIDPNRVHVSDEKLFGNIGQDLLKQYKKVIIDFGNSHLSLTNN